MQMPRIPLADPRFAPVSQTGELPEFFEPDELVLKAGKISIETTWVWEDKDKGRVDHLNFRADAAGGSVGAKIAIYADAHKRHDFRLKASDLPQQVAPTTENF